MSEPSDDILLTAYALGEVDDPADLARAERLVSADASAARAVDELRATALVLTEGFKGEALVGLTAIQYAGIERRLAADAASDAPHPAGPIPLRRNWGLWGSVAASTLIVASVMATVLPELWRDRVTNVGGGKAGGRATAGGDNTKLGGESEAVQGSGVGGLAAASDRSPPSPGLNLTRPLDANTGGNDPDGAPAGDPAEWPLLLTSAGGLPWPVAPAPDAAALRGPAFVVAGDFPLALVPPTGAYPQPAGRGNALAAVRSAVAAGRLPAPQSVRSDELVNAVRYEDVPVGDDLVSAAIERAVCPWDSGHLLVRVVVHATGRGPAAVAASPDPASPDPAAPPTDATPSPEAAATAPAVVPLVRDLRLSVEVNPAAVAGYRVLGYENAPRSWGEWAGRDDREVFAAGKTFTVLLEVVPAGQAMPAPSTPASPLRYRRHDPVAVTSTDMLTVSVEYRQGPMGTPRRIDLPPPPAEGSAIELASPDFRTAAAAAALGVSLRRPDPTVDPALDVAVKLLSDVNATAPTEDRQALLDVAKAVRAMRRP